ncbi:MAG: glucose-methanol-choline oxidoreductase, partial [Acidimicrobiaceae bacterium]|nr:glucose-methanol-choline oxidoreductase [Acidimicrobiaceae bacterium]
MERFDYVVVGAGSAGCVLAARLSEDPGNSVLLLEAGPRDRHPYVHIPAAFPQLFDGRLDWAYRTVAQAQLGDRRVFWPRGKVLGGSSSLNAMLWVRGFPADYDAWASCAGPTWSYEALLPTFLKIEDTEGATPDDPLHGSGGPMPVSALRDPNPLTGRFLEAAEQIGMARLDDPNAGGQGASEFVVTQRRGRRVSAADAYLRPARHRQNLVVRTGAQATEIVFSGRRATGVGYRSGRSVSAVQATREVVLAAGAIGSPQLLLCSGVGRGEDLARLGIDVVADRPAVGENLQDHLTSGIAVASRRKVTLTSARTARALARYLIGRRGPLTSTVAEAMAFLSSRPGLAGPDLELVFLPVPFLDEGLRLPERHGVSLAAVLLQPESRGAVSISSPDPAVAPRIDPRYLSDRGGLDREVLAAGVRTCQRILAAPP